MKYILIIVLFFSVQSYGQLKLYAERRNIDNTIDPFYTKGVKKDSVFNSQSTFICLTVESFDGQFEPVFPQSFGSFVRCADGIWRNFIPRISTVAAFIGGGVDNGSTDSYVITSALVPSSYQAGMLIFFRANTINTGAASINVNGLGVKTIVKRVNTTLANGDILANMWCQLIYDGTNFILLNPVVN